MQKYPQNLEKDIPKRMGTSKKILHDGNVCELKNDIVETISILCVCEIITNASMAQGARNFEKMRTHTPSLGG